MLKLVRIADQVKCDNAVSTVSGESLSNSSISALEMSLASLSF